MPKVRANGDARWSRRAGAATEDYKSGILDPREDWQAATVRAEPAYRAGLTASLASHRWDKQVAKTGTEHQQQRSIQVGAGRFAEGVGLATPTYRDAVAPYLQRIASLSLPVRYAKGDPRNIERVKVIDVALHNLKTGVTSPT